MACEVNSGFSLIHGTILVCAVRQLEKHMVELHELLTWKEQFGSVWLPYSMESDGVTLKTSPGTETFHPWTSVIWIGPIKEPTLTKRIRRWLQTN